jgi:type VI secretion system protein ImpJ
MLLAPHHFQQADQRQEALIHYHARALGPLHWGVRRLKINEVALSNGAFRVDAVEAVLPDGILVEGPSQDDEPLEVSLLPYSDQAGKVTVTVHLAVPRVRGADEPTAGSLKRFLSVPGGEVVDENTFDSPMPIARLKPNASLQVTRDAEEESPGDQYTSLPLAKIEILEKSFTRSVSYLPPVMDLTSRPELAQAVSELVSSIREKATVLAEKSRTARSPSPQDEETVRSLTAGLPAVEALLANQEVRRATHPQALYEALCAMSGPLSGLELGEVPPLFGGYQHRDIYASFAPVVRFCRRMAEGIRPAHRVQSMVFEEGAFRIQLEPEWVVNGGLVVSATPSSGMTAADVHDWVVESFIGTDDKIKSIRERRIRGAERESIDRDETLRVTSSRNAALFRIEVDPEFVNTARTLLLANPAQREDAPYPSEIVLYTPGEPEE